MVLGKKTVIRRENNGRPVGTSSAQGRIFGDGGDRLTENWRQVRMSTASTVVMRPSQKGSRKTLGPERARAERPSAWELKEQLLFWKTQN